MQFFLKGTGKKEEKGEKEGWKKEGNFEVGSLTTSCLIQVVLVLSSNVISLLIKPWKSKITKDYDLQEDNHSLI